MKERELISVGGIPTSLSIDEYIALDQKHREAHELEWKRYLDKKRNQRVVSAGGIARLSGVTRLWAYRHMKRGDFGPLIGRRGRTPFVSLAAVEMFLDREFSDEQFERSMRCPCCGSRGWQPKRLA